MKIRRKMIVGIAATPLLLRQLSFAQEAAATELKPPEAVSFSWRVLPAHRALVESTLKYKGSVTTENEKGLPIVAVFVGIALLPYLANAIIDLQHKLTRLGIVIDTRQKEIKISTDPNLPKGAILLIDKSGSKLIEPADVKDPSDLVKAISASLAK